MNRRRRNRRSGFTLLEVLLVLVILVILGSMATVFIRGAGKRARYNAAKAQISGFEDAIEMYEIDNLGFPSTLQDLRSPPAGYDPYLNKEIPVDPWGNPYQYESDGENFRIWSLGPDGSDGTADDISNV